MLDVTHEEWLRRAKSLDLSGAHHIDGVDESGSGASFAAVSPRDGQVLTEVADGSTAEVDAAVAAARRTFGTGPWPRLAPAERGRMLVRVAEPLKERRADLALTVSLERGKPITEYGLAAGLWTSDPSTAHRVSRALKAATVWVNCYEEGDLTVPFGGMKQSGNGRDKSVPAIEKYSEPKTTWIQL
jgi:acyl-CoA reductase-like NAD-dependent aldehyde dehydrogenase